MEPVSPPRHRLLNFLPQNPFPHLSAPIFKQEHSVGTLIHSLLWFREGRNHLLGTWSCWRLFFLGLCGQNNKKYGAKEVLWQL